MEQASHSMTRLQQWQEPRDQDIMRAVRGLAEGKGTTLRAQPVRA